MKKHKLSTRVVWVVVVFSLLIILATCISINNRYKKDMMNHYSEQALAYASIAAEYIDGDKIAGYLETGETDAYYDEVERWLNASQNNSELEYYYVYVPCEDNLVYVWDASGREGACALGDYESYMEGGKQVSFDAFQREPKTGVLINEDDTYGYIASVVYPVFDSTGEPVALVGVDISMPGVKQDILQFVLNTCIHIIVVIVLFSIGLIVVIRQKLVRPIDTLNQASQEMVGNLEKGEEFSVDVHTGDEIEELARSFEQMNRELVEYIHQLSQVTAEKERIGAELNVATKIQADMLPSIFPPFPGRKDMDIYATMNPAKEVGGDFYDFFLIDQQYLAIVMADVSGKGVPAALFMVIAKTLIKNRALMGGNPAEILEFVNNQLCENNESEMFVTVWLGILDLSTGVMTASNAGHEYPAFRKAGGQFELIHDDHGFVLAGMEDMPYQNYEITFSPGDSLYLYTDGVVEATNAKEELYGDVRMLEALNSQQGSGCEQTLHNVWDGIQGFVKDAPQFDDITMLCFTYYGSSDSE